MWLRSSMQNKQRSLHKSLPEAYFPHPDFSLLLIQHPGCISVLQGWTGLCSVIVQRVPNTCQGAAWDSPIFQMSTLGVMHIPWARFSERSVVPGNSLTVSGWKSRQFKKMREYSHASNARFLILLASRLCVLSMLTTLPIKVGHSHNRTLLKSPLGFIFSEVRGEWRRSDG